jgi:mono/diheme cytochrome c family protein
MRTILRVCRLLVPAAWSALVAVPAAEPLQWLPTERVVAAGALDMVAATAYHVVNRSKEPVTVTAFKPSCSCTTVAAPDLPWLLTPGQEGDIGVTVALGGKRGELQKSIQVESSAGAQLLLVTVKIAPTDEPQRRFNLSIATADRQAVFRGQCADCHVKPAVGKVGESLFAAACLSCHAKDRRASMVPDLGVAREHRDAAYWRRWIAKGRENTLMPGFGQAAGGPLTAQQVESLVAYALANLPSDPQR